MAALFPFRALRPIPSSAPRVAAVPYDVVSTAEAKALASDALSFLRVSRAEIDLPPGANPHSDEVYAKAVTNMAALTREAPLITEESPALYLYRLEMGGHVQTGVAGCFSLEEYEHGLIRRHERTRRDKEDDRARHVLDLRAQTGPVFLTYRASGDVRDICARAIEATSPLFDFEAADAVRHTVWRLDAPGALVRAFARIPALYIADGHHRAAAAARARRCLRDARGEAGGEAGEWDTFLAVAFPHDEVQVLPYNRIVRDLGSRTPDTLLDAVRQRFVVRHGGAVPERPGDVAMYLGGRWHTVTLGGASPDAGPDAGPDARLDVSRLHEQVLSPLLGIGDARTDARIEFVGGIRGPGALETLVQSGAAAVAFSMYPVSVEEIMAISDDGGIMPPKSSWFEPKLRDGLLVHVI
jgi:uncharacterized protein (DUF1015 family)